MKQPIIQLTDISQLLVTTIIDTEQQARYDTQLKYMSIYDTFRVYECLKNWDFKFITL